MAALCLSFFIFFAAYEVAGRAFQRVQNPENFPVFSLWGVLILFVIMSVNLANAQLEARRAKKFNSQLLKADSIHNVSDFWVSISVLVSLVSAKFRIPFIDEMVSFFIAGFLVYLGIRIARLNLRSLIDEAVLDPDEVEKIASAVEGVVHCHAIRSRGQDGHHFLDLNLHLPGKLSLEEAHDISHRVEDELKSHFTSLADVVIHTEPHGHSPCGTCSDLQNH